MAALGEAFCVEVRRSSCDLSFTGEMLTGSVQRSTWTRYCESGPGADFDTEPEDDESGEDWQPERVPDGLSCVADGKVVVVRYREVANTGPLTRVKLTTENLSVLNWPLDGDEGDTIYIGDTGLVIDVEDPTQDATLTIEGLSEQGDVPYDCTVEFKAQS